jgi:DNA-binding transcriptional regulator YdaS (Cro superfamily)
MAEAQAVLTVLRQSASAWERRMDGGPPVPPVSEDEAKAARLSPRLVQSLRKRLRLSQMALARLVGVSAPAVAQWEAGNSSPKGPNRAALIGLRKVGKREARELLARGVKQTESRRARPRKPSTRRRRRKKK